VLIRSTVEAPAEVPHFVGALPNTLLQRLFHIR
jgi:hypothetical protein